MEKNEWSFSPERQLFPPPVKKSGSWTDSSNKSKTKEALGSSVSRDDSLDDIPLIPDVDDLQDDELFGEMPDVVEYPQKTIASFTQLNSDLKKYASFSVLDDINLGLLSKHLYREGDFKENEGSWSWDLLFTEVSSELRSEWKKQDAED